MKLENISQRLADAAARLALAHPKHAHLFSPEKRLDKDGNVLCCIVTCNRKLETMGLCATHHHRINHCKHGLMPEILFKESKAGERNGRWKGGVIVDKAQNRTLIYAPDHPNPTANGTHVYRYRLIAEQMLGRFLTSDEIVHHKNGDESDDRSENLEVMTQSEHIKTHEIWNRNKK